jgi:hypothetical protein
MGKEKLSSVLPCARKEELSWEGCMGWVVRA